MALVLSEFLMLPCPRGKPWLTRLSAQEVTTLDFRIPEHGSQVNDRNPLSMTLGYDMLRHDATCVGTDGEIVGTLVRQKLFASCFNHVLIMFDYIYAIYLHCKY